MLNFSPPPPNTYGVQSSVKPAIDAKALWPERLEHSITNQKNTALTITWHNKECDIDVMETERK